MHSPIVSLLGPKNRLGWAIRYAILALGVIGTVFAHDVLQDNAFHGVTRDYIGAMVMIGLPLYAVVTGIMADMGRLRVQLIEASETDQMTGLLQRLPFIKRTERKLQQTGVLMMLDIDGLGQINAKHDHHAGDLCLMALAIRLREVTRATDVVGRIDGATIAVYLPGTTLDAGRSVAERLAQGIQVTTGTTRFEVTVSVGVAMADGQTALAVLMQQAEAALLRAKARGRAQVMMSDGKLAA
ncbi:GGDEF domain-containing protein [Yoonia sp. F2084L]|uniref:GGDEF domain-containing protein n=1 Tax=Yoonia sp. F2084L TaxID=2926419 RepID=UPI001FF5D5CF|nr:GGDEF domain-containing protein [Yoonia sp. F2084L]MCK0094672.1 GGDEF domain-containing protein [Yoonia sp. F2084L]